MRGTMLREGRVACDGEILSERCASCWLQSRGVPARVARCIGKLPQDFFGLLEPVPRVGPLLAAKKLAENRSKQVREMSAAADRIVAVCDWLQKALLANGVPARKLSLNRQGTGQSGQFIHPTVPKHGPTFRFGFLGRWDPVKGVHVLVDAFKRLGKSLQVELHICAVAGGSDSKRYRENVQFSAADERRIHFLPEINPEQVFEFLTEIDVLVVPSQWLETGPLVVLEAFAAGTPVIGSDLGGIKELVTHGRNGLLISRDDVTAWTEAMARIAVDRELFCQLRSGIGSVRTMSHVADDMVNLYSELLTESSYVA
jgi:glycosyltransferase involved in cell wall biosynthesis